MPEQDAREAFLDDVSLDREIAEAEAADLPPVEAEPLPPEVTVRLQPLYDRVLVRRHPERQTYGQGIIHKADTVIGAEKQLVGDVLEVGEGIVHPNGVHQKMRVEKGDIVLFGAFAGVELPAEVFGPNSDLLVLREDEILGIVTVETGAATQAEVEPSPDSGAEFA